MTTVVAHKYVDQRSWKTGILERYLPGDSMATAAVSTAATRRATPGASGLAEQYYSAHRGQCNAVGARGGEWDAVRVTSVVALV